MYYYDRTEAVVDLSVFRKNMENIRAMIPAGVRLCPIIKTDAYGHGMVMMAREIEDLSDYFGLATVDEAVRLRREGVRTPVFLLGFTDESRFGELFDYDIYPNIFSLETAKKLSEEAVRRGKKLKFHLSVDTGMNRVGFQRTQENLEIIQKICQLPGLVPEGIFSHFVSADSSDRSLTLEQIRRFTDYVDQLEEKGVHFPIRHISASAGGMDYPEARLDMVRSGIINYGLYPSDEVCRDHLSVSPVLSLISRVTLVKEIQPGETISYGATFAAPSVMRIATIPVGYGDGYPRSLSNRGSVLIAGKRARICGRVCMDQFMVDVTDIPEAGMGSKVTLIGRDGADEISADEIAALAGTISYEILCDLGRRIPRVYIRDGVMVGRQDWF